MTVRHSFFASESRALRIVADALPGKGAFTLLGAPMLAVVVTFWLQPKASGSVPSRGEEFQSARGGAETMAQPAQVLAADQIPEPFTGVAAALEARDYAHARKLLANLAPTGNQERQLHEAYTLMLECLESPNNDLVAHAYRFYLEQAPSDVRSSLRAACLPSH